MQETLLTASKRMAEYVRDPRLPFHAWLRQIALIFAAHAGTSQARTSRRNAIRSRNSAGVNLYPSASEWKPSVGSPRISSSSRAGAGPLMLAPAPNMTVNNPVCSARLASLPCSPGSPLPETTIGRRASSSSAAAASASAAIASMSSRW